MTISSANSSTSGSSAASHRAPLGLAVCACLAIVILAAIVTAIVHESFVHFHLFSNILTSNFLIHGRTFSLTSLLTGSLFTSAFAVVFAAPIGIFAALYLSELASRRVRALLQPLLVVFAGVPPVVYGYFAVSTLLPTLVAVVPSAANHGVLLVGLSVGVMMLPLVIANANAAFSAVPQNLRNAARALGASQASTAAFVVIPAARSRLVAALVLAASRALGETLVVLAILWAFLPGQTESGATLTTLIASNGRSGALPKTPEYGAMFIAAGVLLVVAFVLDLVRTKLTAPSSGDAP